MIPDWQIEGYERLRVAIVKSAVRDLRKAMRKSARLGSVCEEQKTMEEWFLSKWGQLLCEDRGEYIIDRCWKTYKRKKGGTKQKIPDDVQLQIYKDYKNGVKNVTILKKYNINSSTLYFILKRWED